MKHLLLIFSLYIFSLSLFPCGDEGREKTSVYAAEHHHTNNDDCGNICSPFCTCTCCSCAGFIFSEPPVVMVEAAAASNFTEQKTQTVIDVSLPVWQPPRRA